MTMTIDLSQVLPVLNRLAAVNLSPWLATVGAHAAQEAQLRITVGKADPDNAPWSPWSQRRRAEREAKGNAGQGLLWDTGTLLSSIRFTATGDEVVIGTDVPYARELQEGRPDMSARPFLGWSDGEIAELEFSAVRFLEGLML